MSAPSSSNLQPLNAAASHVKEIVLLKINNGKVKIMDIFKGILDKAYRRDLLLIGGVTAVGLTGVLMWYAHKRLQKPAHKIAFDEGTTVLTDVESRSTLTSSEQPPEQLLTLYQCPRGRRTPCIAPHPLKLETFLRVFDINYNIEFTGSEPRNQNSPWMTLDLEAITDPQTCITRLIEKYNLGSKVVLTEQEKAVSLAFIHMLENHLYWAIALWRWVYNDAKNITSIQVIPKKTLDMVPDVARTVEQAAWFHGIGKKPISEVTAAVCNDLRSLSEFLGNKYFFLGKDSATELDCSAFAMLSQILWNMDGSEYYNALQHHKNLVDFCWRMRTRYWPDWEDCLNNQEKPEEDDKEVQKDAESASLVDVV